MTGLRILVADDHEVVRHGLRTILESQPGWKICGEARTGREAVVKALELKPDMVVLKFGMPELNGLEATRQIHKRLPKTEILVLTVYPSERLAREFLAAGARGYILQGDAAKLLIEAVEHLQQHKPFFTARVSEMVLNGFSRPNHPGVENYGDRLTAREREVVQLVAEGKRSREIAERLDISVHTVESHRTNIMRKLEIHTVGELIRYAIRNKITEP